MMFYEMRLVVLLLGVVRAGREHAGREGGDA